MAASTLSVPGEKTLVLSDGRTLAYSCGGQETSTKVVITLHGVFGVGSCDRHLDHTFTELGWRCISPTLPGWGRSSPWPKDVPIAAFVADMQELLAHEVGKPTHILVFGGSYGSVWAYVVAANKPPAGFKQIEPSGAIRGLCILGGFSPYADDDGYAAALQGMTTMNWLTVGRPGKSIFLGWILPLFGRFMRNKLVSGGHAAGLEIIRSILTGPDAMKPEERAEIEAWAVDCGTTFETWESDMARNTVLSVRDTFEGFRVTPHVINSDWGFSLDGIVIPGAGTDKRPSLTLAGRNDLPETLPPVVIGGALRDHLAPIAMQQWVAAHIPGAQMLEMQGNHIAGVILVLPIFKAMIHGIEAADRERQM